MSKFRITYKPTGKRLNLPEEVEASRYITNGQFIQFVDHDLFNPVVVRTVSADLIADISLVSTDK